VANSDDLFKFLNEQLDQMTTLVEDEIQKIIPDYVRQVPKAKQPEQDDMVIFSSERLNNLQVTIGVLAEDYEPEVGVLTAPISYIGEDGKWTVVNLPIYMLNEVFAKELDVTESLPTVIQLYIQDLEKKVNEK